MAHKGKNQGKEAGKPGADKSAADKFTPDKSAENKPAPKWSDDIEYGRFTHWKDHSCHYGHSVIGEVGSARLMAAGWTRGARPSASTAVIDLTGRYTRPSLTIYGDGFGGVKDYYQAKSAPILHLTIRDFDVPAWEDNLWPVLARDVQALLEKGTDVLVACDGGHGRTGMVVAILAHKLGMVSEGEDPIDFVRRVHCIHAVETWEQEAYVYQVLGMPIPAPLVTKCKVCSVNLDEKYGDDLRAGLCVMCRPDKHKAVISHEIVTSEPPKADKSPDGECGYCGQPLYKILGDNLTTKTCVTCMDKMEKLVYDLAMKDEADTAFCDYCGMHLEEGDDLSGQICRACAGWCDDNGIAH